MERKRECESFRSKKNDSDLQQGTIGKGKQKKLRVIYTSLQPSSGCLDFNSVWEQKWSYLSQEVTFHLQGFEVIWKKGGWYFCNECGMWLCSCTIFTEETYFLMTNKQARFEQDINPEENFRRLPSLCVA